MFAFHVGTPKGCHIVKWRQPRETRSEIKEVCEPRGNEDEGPVRIHTGKRLSARKTSQAISNLAKPTTESFKTQLFLFSIIKQCTTEKFPFKIQLAGT